MYAELHPDADREFTAYALFYESQEPGLGSRFIEEIELGIKILVSHSQIGP